MRVVVKSHGCSTNLADGAVLAGCLNRAGHEIVSTVSAADVVIYNTCAVKGPTENRMIEALRRVPRDKKLIVVGCLPLINAERIQKEISFDGLAGPAVGKKVVDIVASVAKGERVCAVEGSLNNKPELTLPRIHPSSVVSVVPISYGCLGSCTYCCVVFARGRLRSYTIKEIVERMEDDVRSGFREFWLTAQDTACYGKDIETNLAELLSSICRIKGDFHVRVGMMTPNYLLGILDDVVRAFHDEKIFKFLHLPVQSGDDQILGTMRRFYLIADFRRIVDTFRLSFPQLSLATDLICGFPGESGEAFERTLELIQHVKPDVLNVSKFYARPRTLAADTHTDRVPIGETKKRSIKVGVLAKEIASEKNRQWLNWEGPVLIDEVGKLPGSWIGRNFAYKPIVVTSAQPLLGQTVTVRVSQALPTFLRGRISVRDYA